MTSVTPYNSASQCYEGINDKLESNYVKTKEKNIAASTSKDIELSLTTKEGDIVTLHSNSFVDFESFTYDQNGCVKNSLGETNSNVSYREMALTSGSSFTFSVSGDLNESELDDIENMLGKIDEIIAEMTNGDMDKALSKAFEMDGYETVSEFTADLSISQSYSIETQIEEEITNAPTDNTKALLEKTNTIEELALEELSLMDELRKTILEKMTELMEESSEKLYNKSKKPVEQLLTHHINESEDNKVKDFLSSTLNAFDESFFAA